MNTVEMRGFMIALRGAFLRIISALCSKAEKRGLTCRLFIQP